MHYDPVAHTIAVIMAAAGLTEVRIPERLMHEVQGSWLSLEGGDPMSSELVYRLRRPGPVVESTVVHGELV